MDKEKLKWEKGTQNKELEMYGDKYMRDENGRELFLHFANNLLSLLMGNRLTPALILLFVGMGIACGAVLYILYRKEEKTVSPKEPLAALSLLPLLLYATYCVFMAALRL